MPEAIRVTDNVVVPEGALTLKTARASGPGGQNVNKVASKVVLRVDLDRIEGLTPGARERLGALAANRRDAEGLLVVTSQRTRDQGRNLEDARKKVKALVSRALHRPRVRRPTHVPAAAVEARISRKKQHSARKRGRSRVEGEE